MSVLCAHCGQPIADATANRDGERFFHGACYALEFPPEHPEEWPPIQRGEAWASMQAHREETTPPFKGISRYSHDERVHDGLEQP